MTLSDCWTSFFSVMKTKWFLLCIVQYYEQRKIFDLYGVEEILVELFKVLCIDDLYIFRISLVKCDIKNF